MGLSAYAKGTAGSAFENKTRNQHASRHLIDEGVLPNWNKNTEELFKKMGISILENPTHTFDHILRDGNTVKGYVGQAEGKIVVFMVYKEGINKGLVATAIVPSLQQMSNWGIK